MSNVNEESTAQIKAEVGAICLSECTPQPVPPSLEQQLHIIDADMIARREYKNSPEVRRLQRVRKRRQRERLQLAQEQAHEQAEADRLAARQKAHCELNNLVALGEVNPGVKAQTRQEWLESAKEFSGLVGPYPRYAKQETYRNFFRRLLSIWMGRGTPLLDRANRKLVDKNWNRLHEYTGLSANEFSHFVCRDVFLQKVEESWGPEFDHPIPCVGDFASDRRFVVTDQSVAQS